MLNKNNSQTTSKSPLEIRKTTSNLYQKLRNQFQNIQSENDKSDYLRQLSEKQINQINFQQNCSQKENKNNSNLQNDPNINTKSCKKNLFAIIRKTINNTNKGKNKTKNVKREIQTYQPTTLQLAKLSVERKFRTNTPHSKSQFSSSSSQNLLDFSKMPSRFNEKDTVYKQWQNQNENNKLFVKKSCDKSQKIFQNQSGLMDKKQSVNKSTSNLNSVNTRNVTPRTARIDLTQEQRKRDFSSQIITLPGPLNPNQREHQERSMTPNRKPLHPLNQKIQESYYFQAERSNNLNEGNDKSKNNLSSDLYTKYKSFQKDVNQGIGANRHKQKHNLHEFLYRTPRNFIEDPINKTKIY